MILTYSMERRKCYCLFNSNKSNSNHQVINWPFRSLFTADHRLLLSRDDILVITIAWPMGPFNRPLPMNCAYARIECYLGCDQNDSHIDGMPMKRHLLRKRFHFIHFRLFLAYEHFARGQP